MFFKKKKKEPLISTNALQPGEIQYIEKDVKVINPLLEQQIHERELAQRIRAMDEREWEIVADNIPVDILIRKIERELIKKVELEAKINDMYQQFFPNED